MMSVTRFTLKLHRFSLITARFHHLSRILQRKEYKYDLDSLIQWKKETALIFGSVRKLTKTGKLKKTKKSLDPQLEENLQILSDLSISGQSTWELLDNVAVKNTKASENCTADDILLSSSDAIPTFGHEDGVQYVGDLGYSTNDSFFNIPDGVFISFDIPHDAEPVFKKDYHSKDCKESFYSKDDIVIPKISPVPTTSSSESAKKFRKSSYENHVNAAVARVTAAHVSEQKINYSKDETVNNLNSEDVTAIDKMPTFHKAELLLAKPRDGKNSNTTKKTSTKTKEDSNSSMIFDPKSEDGVGKKLREAEIFIPKMKPIPLGTISYASSGSSPLQQGVSSVPSSQSIVSDTILNLPFEPPESFQVISKIPLFPIESKGWQRKIDSDLLDTFKMDVKQMSFKTLPSVKSILNRTMSDLNRFFLNRWREKLIQELGEEGFKLQQDATIRNGVNLHANIMEILSGKSASELQIMPDNEGHWCSLQSALTAVKDVRALEMNIFHNMLLYRGIFDCLAQYKDLLCMIDWKSSKKPRPLLKNTYDDPVQIAAYIGALNSSEAYVKKYGQVSHGMIVVAYPDGSPAHIHIMNKSVCEQHWHDWTERLYKYYQLTYTAKMAANTDTINARKNISSLGAVQ